jgi:tRNA(Ile)-lysidine synthase
MKFLNIVKACIEEFEMLAPGDSVLIAVSGGPDSIAMSLALLSLQRDYGLRLGIAHLNHMLRKDEAQRDETFVKEFAEKSGLEFYALRSNAALFAEKHGLSIEEAGRKLRYDFFSTISDRHGFDKIATGHTRDDNVELVLMNLLRGSGLKGLSGIPPKRENRFIRPLIRSSKEAILDFLADCGQKYMIDSSNLETQYLRNKIRNTLIPLLQAEYNPSVTLAIDRTASIFRQEEDYLENEADSWFEKCLVSKNDSQVCLSAKRISGLHPAMQNRVLRNAVKWVKKDLRRISLIHLEQITELISPQGRPGTSLDLPGRIRIYRHKKVIEIKKEAVNLRELGKKQKKLQNRKRRV